jgi:radical SAM protein with 4Fe4S-binding SPASM domain
MQEFLHEHKTFTDPTLKHLDIETSSLCNLSCQMCPRPKENGTMPIDDIKRLIKEFADIGGSTIKPFWRGEVLADERMPEILKWAKECGLKTMVNTNGQDTKGVYIDCLPYIDWISFSIDEQHGNINTSTLYNVIDAIQCKVPYVEIQSSKYNSYMRFTAKGFNIPYKVDLPTKRSDKDTTSEVITGDRKYCGFPEWRMVVAYNGDCIPCCTMWGKSYVLGNIYEQSLSEIFNGYKANTLRSELKQGVFNNKECANCVSRGAYKC